MNQQHKVWDRIQITYESSYKLSQSIIKIVKTIFFYDIFYVSYCMIYDFKNVSVRHFLSIVYLAPCIDPWRPKWTNVAFQVIVFLLVMEF